MPVHEYRDTRGRLAPTVHFLNPLDVLAWAIDHRRADAADYDVWVDRLTAGVVATLRHRWVNATFAPFAYTIDVSEDAQHWRTVKTVVGNGLADRTDTFDTFATERYVRMRVTNSYGDHGGGAGLALTEIELNGELPIATSPETTFQPGNTDPAYVVDGDVSTLWQPLRKYPDGQSYIIEVDRGFGALYGPSMETVTAQWYPSDPFNVFRAIDYTIEVSDDAVTWVTACTVVGNTQDTRTDAVSASGRHFRYVVTRHSDDVDVSYTNLALIETTWTKAALAHPLVASASSTYQANNPANAIDGDTGTYWQASTPLSSTVVTFMLDRGATEADYWTAYLLGR